MKIPFNKPYISGKEIEYIKDVYAKNHLSGNGAYTKKVHKFFEDKYGFKKALLTNSGTAALEMSALLMDIKSGDEVIMPSYTFVSTALAYVRQGAKIVFIDSKGDHPGLNENEIEKNITKRTKAIVAVHYAGVACDMDKIMQIAEKYDLFVVEDAAQAIDSYYMDKHLGGIGDFGCFSFHETKNIHCGEGGLLTINNPEFKKRSEIIWEKGTNRAEFFRGEVNKYGWVDIGSSFLPSEMNAAFLYAQIENLNNIQNKRKAIWKQYYKGLKPLEDKGYLKLPVIPEYATNNAHMFYLVCNTADERTKLIQHLKKNGVHAVFHYLSLHKSDYYEDKHDGRDLPNADIYTDCLVRLPMYYGIKREEIKLVVRKVREFWLL